MTETELRELLAVAQNPATPPLRLDELVLYKNDTINRFVVENPNSPMETVLSLSSAYPRAFLQNPALIMWALEDPGFFQKWPLRLQEVLAREHLSALLEYSVDLVVGMALHANVQVRLALASNQDLPAELLALLGQESRIPKVQYAIATNPNTSTLTLRLLARVKDKWCRAKVAMHPHTPPDVLHALAADADQWVQGNVAANPNTPEATMELLRRLATPPS